MLFVVPLALLAYYITGMEWSEARKSRYHCW